jgi:hypothetical protein
VHVENRKNYSELQNHCNRAARDSFRGEVVEMGDLLRAVGDWPGLDLSVLKSLRRGLAFKERTFAPNFGDILVTGIAHLGKEKLEILYNKNSNAKLNLQMGLRHFENRSAETSPRRSHSVIALLYLLVGQRPRAAVHPLTISANILCICLRGSSLHVS